METNNLVLRTIYLDPDVDDQLRTEAFDTGTSKNDLIQQYLRLGMETARKASQTDVPATEDHADQRVMENYPSTPGNFGAASYPSAGSYASGGYASTAGNAGMAGSYSAAGTPATRGSMNAPAGI